MIISDLNHMEITNEADNLAGGLDFSLNSTIFHGASTIMQSGTTSGPSGSVSVSNSQHTQIDTGAFNLIALGA